MLAYGFGGSIAAFVLGVLSFIVDSPSIPGNIPEPFRSLFEFWGAAGAVIGVIGLIGIVGFGVVLLVTRRSGP